MSPDSDASGRVRARGGVPREIRFDGFKDGMTVRSSETGFACFTDP
jgi:hypothetical protein